MPVKALACRLLSRRASPPLQSRMLAPSGAAPTPRFAVLGPSRGLRPPLQSRMLAPSGAAPTPRFAVLGPSRGLRGLYQLPSQSLGSAGYMARQTSCQSKPWHAACYRAAPAKTYRLCAPSRAAIRGL